MCITLLSTNIDIAVINDDITNIEKLVKRFGKQLKLVPLLAPQDIVRKSMEEHYSDYVTPQLLNKWQKDPMNAPGRLTSSPWPDRIEIISIHKVSDDQYIVIGKIIEITSAEKLTRGVASLKPIILTLARYDGRFIIVDVD